MDTKSSAKCPRCGLTMRILFHMERYCPNDCDRMPPGPPCPKCKSHHTEVMQITTFFGPPEQKMHCWPCGAMWNLEPEPMGTD